MTNFKLRKLDFMILKELKEDARQSASEIARKLENNERTIRRRISYLERHGLISFSAIVNSKMLGYSHGMDIFITVSPEEEEKVIGNLLSFTEIFYLAHGIGDHNISFQVRFKTQEDLLGFLKHNLPSMEGVTIKGFMLIPNVLKASYEWFPSMDDFEPSIKR